MDALRGLLRDLKDGKHLITIKDYRKRSLQQNDYYWAVVVPLVRKGLFDAGFDEVTDNEIAHEVVKKFFLKTPILSKQTGEIIDIGGSSTKLTVPEFSEFLERVVKWASEYLGIYIPSPNEPMAELFEYSESLNNF